ncbi:MAG: BCD family MFS transporter [Hyphomicrobiaceae bacterium]
MKRLNDSMARLFSRIDTRYLPFADAASPELPMARLLRLSMFQVSVAMAVVLLNGTLNRVMIVELGVPSVVVAAMISLPLLFAPLRALIGFKSDTHRSAIGWRRTPFIWIGSMLQFGGLAIMPFALLILSGDTTGPAWIGVVGAALAFLLVGAGMHVTQTAGLALATDIAPPEARPRVVAFLYVVLLVGMIASSLVFGQLLSNFSQIRLIQLVQGAAVATVAFNVVALWKQEHRVPRLGAAPRDQTVFADAWRHYRSNDHAMRSLVALALGTTAFSMQDILLEPYGGEILGLSVGQTTVLTGLFAAGNIVGFIIAARYLARGIDPYRLAGYGAAIGLLAFPAVIAAAPLEAAGLFRVGTIGIGLGAGLFAIGTLIAAMNQATSQDSGLAVGAWGAVQATAAGIAITLGAGIRDSVAGLAASGHLGRAFDTPAAGYNTVYHVEIALLIATLVAIGPLARATHTRHTTTQQKFGLAEFPG